MGAHAAYGYAAGVPFASSTGLDALTQGLDASTQGVAPYAAYAGHGLGYYGKRDAEADPALLYGGYAGYGYAGVPFTSSTGLDLITQGLDASTQGFAPYANYGYGLGYYGKRDADADPALLYSGYAGYGYAGVPFASSTGLDPITQGLDASTQGFAPYAHYGYGLGYYGKRDAEADPQLLYGGYGGYAGYAGYPYAYGITHPSNLGLCVNYLGAQVPC